MRIKVKVTSVILAFMMLFTVIIPGGFSVTATVAGVQLAQETVQGSAILHCFNWSYNSIKDNLQAIAAAGYTAVQTSPVQQPKDFTMVYTDQKDQWWKLYQPLGLSIAADGTSWIGTKQELKELCEAAEGYGIKVIVDIVANHLANNGSDGGGFGNVSSEIEEDLKNADYFHSENNYVNDSSRYAMTQYHLGMPDLNTSNSYVQGRILGLMKDCVDLGVDGFRFDAAKHIELPTDPNCGSDFWPNIINGIKAYTNNELYFYGEILNSAGTDISNYTPYIDVTDNYSGDYALNAAYTRNSGALAVNTYNKGGEPKDSVIWAESHDTYMGGSGSAGISNTSEISDDVIVKAWAIIGSRADSTALYLARPALTMGDASEDTTWKSTAVAEINKFKNYFDGTTEYLGFNMDYTATYNERGTSGVVISKLDGSGYVSLKANKMADGTYIDQVSGGIFKVADGYITGTVGPEGVAVVYNPDSPAKTADTSVLYLTPSSNWKNDGARFAMYVYNSYTAASAWTSMTDEDGDGTFSAAVPEGEWDYVIFCRMDGATVENNWDNKWNQTNDLRIPSAYNSYAVTEGSWSNGTGTWSVTAVPAEEEFVPGDVTGDGETDSLDAAQILKYDAGSIELTEEQLIAGDVTGDGEVDSFDAGQILKYDAGAIDSF